MFHKDWKIHPAFETPAKCRASPCWTSDVLSEEDHENLAIYVIILATRTDANLDDLQQCCLLTCTRLGGIGSLILVRLPDPILNRRMSKLHKKISHHCEENSTQFAEIVQLTGRLVERALNPAGLDPIQLKGLAAMWVAFLVLTIRPTGTGFPKDFERRYVQLGEALFGQVGLILADPCVVNRHLPVVQPNPNTVRQAAVMFNVFVAGTRLYLRWKSEKAAEIQNHLLFATQLVENVSSSRRVLIPRLARLVLL